MRLPLAAPLCSLSLCSLASAQWPAFGDGDLLYRPGNSSGGESVIWRIDPVGGTASQLVPDTFNGYGNGAWMAFDPFRDVVLFYSSRFPTGLFLPRLWAVRADGLLTDLGLADARLAALAPVGDGRVYCTSDRELSLLDADNGFQPVTDPFGQAFDVPVDHLWYDAATNSLIGVASTGFPGTCAGFNEVGLHRYPLETNGLSLRSPATCIAFDNGGFGNPIGLDPLPNGDLLLTLNSGQFADPDLLRLNPQTLALSTFADPSSNDKDGGVWAQGLGAAVFVNDTDNSFRLMPEFGSGSGVEILAGLVPGDNTTGISSKFELTDVDREPGACTGDAIVFGAGLPGTGGLAPTVDAGTCPRIGSVLSVQVRDALPGGVGLLLVGRFPGPLPLFGGTLEVLPPYAAQPTLLADPDGAAQVLLPVPSQPLLVGASFFLQAGFADPAAVQGVSLSPGLEVVLGGA